MPRTSAGATTCRCRPRWWTPRSASRGLRLGARAASMVAAGFTKAYYRARLEMNLSGKPDSCTDANFATWKTRFIEVANAIRTASPFRPDHPVPERGASARVHLAPPIRPPWQRICRLLRRAGGRLLRPVGSDPQLDAGRCASATPRPSAPMNQCCPRPALGKSFCVVAGVGRHVRLPSGPGTRWRQCLLHQLRPRLVRHQPATVEFVCYFEEPAAYLKSGHHHHGHKPTPHRIPHEDRAVRHGDRDRRRRHGWRHGTAYPSKVVAACQEDLVERLPGDRRAGRGDRDPPVLRAEHPAIPGRVHQRRAGLVHGLARIGRRAAGQRVILSLGGAGGAIDISQRSRHPVRYRRHQGAASRRVAPAWTGIDWDLEGRPRWDRLTGAAISSSLKSSYTAPPSPS